MKTKVNDAKEYRRQIEMRVREIQCKVGEIVIASKCVDHPEVLDEMNDLLATIQNHVNCTTAWAVKMIKP